MSEQMVCFPCGDINLEGVLHLPEGGRPLPAAVLCHPHPLYGGCMDNNVVGALAAALVGRGIIALRFNFRGVEGSEGSFGGGEDEQQDVRAALEYLASREEVDAGRLGLAGYSFGARVALPVAVAETNVKATVLVSPPTDCVALKDASKPWLLVYGSRDDIVPGGVESVAGPQVRVKRIEGADHFWWGHETEMAEEAVSFLASYL